MTDSISVICTCYNRRKLTADWLAHFDNVWPTRPCELVMVDDCSTDGTADVLREYRQNDPLHDIRLVLKDRNTGFADTVLKGQQESTGDFVLVTQNDVIFSPGSIDRLVDIFETLDSIWHNGFEDHIGVLGLSGGMVKADDLALTDMSCWNGDDKYGYRRTVKFDYKAVDYLDGWLMLYRRKEAEEHDIWFDARYRFYWEDIDFCRQWIGAGYSAVMVSIDGMQIPLIRHIRNETIIPLVKDYRKYLDESKEIYRQKWKR